MTEDEIPKKEFIEEQRAWLKTYREQAGLSWSELQKRTGTNSSLSLFGGEKGYGGRELPIADAVMRYRELLATRDTTFVDAPEVPRFYQTQTSEEILNLLHWCQRGKMVGGAIGSGGGKSTSCREFKARYPHVYIINLLNSQGSQGPMQIKVLAALGMLNAKGTPHSLSALICERLSQMHRPVLIFDEAQHLTVNALEEIRGWHDETGAGIAFFGDKRLHDLIYHGKGKDDIPQFRSRIKMMPVRLQPYVRDVAAMAEAWNVQERRMIVELERVAQRPGGLRLATQVLELAAMIASAEKKVMSLGHLQEAIADTMRRGIAA